jgi:amidophosphoribosyltransferase
MMGSESIALKQLGFGDIKDILPGQAVFIEKGHAPVFRQVVEQRSYTPDIFEFVYLARPDSMMDGISIYRSRQNMGRKLAKRMRQVLGDKVVDEIDVSMCNNPCALDRSILTLFPSSYPSSRGKALVYFPPITRVSVAHLAPRQQTSNTAAAVLAERLNKPYSEAFIKNRYVHRTFIRESSSHYLLSKLS